MLLKSSCCICRFSPRDNCQKQRLGFYDFSVPKALISVFKEDKNIFKKIK
ncbi:hypothetical protein GCWU000342_00129 [Shuttleworthella satelles DSM 14600]|uniref:Uncharacterized protein n=1 Tax=Shuttleworthella satelles DSM 14600 TaxID=626523 RepID=C4G858_9FIRM|nr:hypothetical protein GCWU000342_00129 [Shuttleworthia satelles DSM 14600]